MVSLAEMPRARGLSCEHRLNLPFEWDHRRCMVEKSIQFYHKRISISLNIKNEETCRLASELAGITGEAMTGAITVALQERLERALRSRSVEARMQAIEAIAHRCSKLLRDGPSAVEHGDYLYDEHGAPK